MESHANRCGLFLAGLQHTEYMERNQALSSTHDLASFFVALMRLVY